MLVVGTDVGRRHEFDAHDAGVNGVLARVKRADPNALVTDIDEIAVLERFAAHVDVSETDE
jgi:hypothetical protein